MSDGGWIIPALWIVMIAFYKLAPEAFKAFWYYGFIIGCIVLATFVGKWIWEELKKPRNVRHTFADDPEPIRRASQPNLQRPTGDQ